MNVKTRDKKILEDYEQEMPTHLICSKYNMTPIELTSYIKECGLDTLRTYRMEGKIEYNEGKLPIESESHSNLIYKSIEELWDKNKTFITLDDAPRPDVIIIDWDNREVVAIEAQANGNPGNDKINIYNLNKPLKPFDTLVIYRENSSNTIELVPKKVESVDYIFMTCKKCSHRWLPNYTRLFKKKIGEPIYLQCSKCSTNNLVPNYLK